LGVVVVVVTRSFTHLKLKFIQNLSENELPKDLIFGNSELGKEKGFPS